MFRSYDKGFQMDFPNGLTVSVMFGRGNYSSNYAIEENLPEMKSQSAEICIFSTIGQIDVFSCDIGCSAGWQSSTQVGRMIGLVSNYEGQNHDELVQKLKLIVQ